jgi:hypothetical protein
MQNAKHAANMGSLMLSIYIHLRCSFLESIPTVVTLSLQNAESLTKPRSKIYLTQNSKVCNRKIVEKSSCCNPSYLEGGDRRVKVRGKPRQKTLGRLYLKEQAGACDLLKRWR